MTLEQLQAFASMSFPANDEAASDPETVFSVDESGSLKAAPAAVASDQLDQAALPGKPAGSEGEGDADVSMKSQGLKRAVVPPESARVRDPGNEPSPKQLKLSPNKQQKLDSSPMFAGNVGMLQESVRCVIGGDEYHHEDEVLDIEYTDADLSTLLEEADVLDEAVEWERGFEKVTDFEQRKLYYPRGLEGDEPQLSSDELGDVDQLAAYVEVNRLLEMGVLMPITLEDASKEELRHLSTRFVTTWRQKKLEGEPVFLRRARFVAREYKWADPHREQLFAPATSSLTSRGLPALFMQKKALGEDWLLFSCDIRDAYLTVDQKIGTYVSAWVDGQEQLYKLLKVLPGQRDGAREWHGDFTAFLSGELGAESCDICPSVVRVPNSFVGNIHVDDVMGLATESFVHEHLLPCLKKKYEITYECIERLGDEIWFLKRRHLYHRSGRMIIQPHQQSLQKLFSLVGLNAPLPNGGIACSLTERPLEPGAAAKYKAAVGLLLYLSTDLVECQFAIKTLSQAMSQPGEEAWRLLRHLCQYLVGARYHAVCFEQPVLRDGFLKKNCPTDLVLEVMTDSDWGGDKRTRCSTSSSVFLLNGNLLYSASRNQKAISLSSGEAEYYAMVSACCDAIFILGVLDFCTFGADISIYVLCDAAAARGIASLAVDESGI